MNLRILASGLALSALAVAGLTAPLAAKPAAKPAIAPSLTARILRNPPEVILPKDHRLTLHLQMIQASIYNPASGREEAVSLRGYAVDKFRREALAPGETDTSLKPFIAPTIEARPGDRVIVTLHNELRPAPTPEQLKACGQPETAPEPCFNITNLHTHGLWISPVQDDVLNAVMPQATKVYTYDIDPNHPAGTFWYHPHEHGSTAFQVGGGMAGALIIKGNRKPSGATNGDVDTLLAPLKVKERIMVLQQIQYACFDANGNIKTYDGKDGTLALSWRCDKGDKGVIKGYAQLGFNGAHSTEQWTVSGRFTSINGEILPVFGEAVAGHVERWRLIDAGMVNTIGVVIRKLDPSAPAKPAYDTLNSQDNAEWEKKWCTGPIVHQFAIATDGLTRSSIVERADFPLTGKPAQTILQPGYREDVLLSFPEAGNYCVIDEAAQGLSSVRTGSAETRPQLLGMVVVRGSANTGDQSAYMQKLLVAAAAHAGYDAKMADAVKADLQDGMKLTHFVPHATLANIPDADLGHQLLGFDIFQPDPKVNKFLFQIGKSLTHDDTYKSFSIDHLDRKLKLGGTDEWELTALNVNHPFHIHINPFQVEKILDPAGNDVSVSGETGDQEYANLKGQWKDTLFVKQGYHIFIRTHYEKYQGRFVLHCHILDHEDQGMMELIQIGDSTLPQETPQTKALMMNMNKM